MIAINECLYCGHRFVKSWITGDDCPKCASKEFKEVVLDQASGDAYGYDFKVKKVKA